MTTDRKKSTPLTIIKIIHTFIWIFFNVVLFYLFYAVLINKIDAYIWIGLSLIFLEGIVLLIFNNSCPLTIIAHNYSASEKPNFDIYLPAWLARYNKLIYTTFLAVILFILIYRILTNK